jgi:hypothetical protein
MRTSRSGLSRSSNMVEAVFIGTAVKAISSGSMLVASPAGRRDDAAGRDAPGARPWHREAAQRKRATAAALECKRELMHMAAMSDRISPRVSRPIDHCVLPVRDLDQARARLTSLGFTVAPVGVHPFGTENACVFLADGTFLEPLAIGQRETAEAAALAGNAFVARDAAYRFRKGGDGFSALVFGTRDAGADHAQFVRAGMSGGKPLAFSRAFVDRGGLSDTATFRLSFAADMRAPDAFFFTCERVNTPNVDRSALQVHANGAAGIATVVLSEPNPTDFQYILQEVANQRDVEAHSFGMDVETAHGRISVLNADGLKAWFGLDRGPERGLALEAIVFRVADLDATRRALGPDVESATIGGRLVVRPAPGQGATFAFEEERR